MYTKIFKRLFDIILSVFALTILSPVLLVTAIAIKIDSPGPVVFKQKRLGQFGQEFEILKFRSMCLNAESIGSRQYSFKSDPRVTRVGRIIRACSIDELLQFINILKGDMSLIGFRPPLTYHPWAYDKYTDEQKVMFHLRPGITGWAQIHGRKGVLWEDRIALNVWYVNNVSLFLDIKILLVTIVKVLMNADNENTRITVESKQLDNMNEKVEKKA
ncbi:sugar transferase [Acetivibrio sp. MSJd-27]|uniref:sugar transferase n=1 Tax=Acetivibrio sp. MSJd-27 TaxID=2841523 RepID=UPI001C116E2B|nr:sugar transferase [Acetivibrio sp. MSJd-27]MBU5450135.1 sugar transferase [Acetivibrio sp. MSJd-27]